MELEKLRFKKAKGTTTKAHLVRHLSFDLVRHLGETKIPGLGFQTSLNFYRSRRGCPKLRKLVNANPRLNRSVNFSCIKMFFTGHVLYSLSLVKLKTERQTS